jgi:hypothetical protein
MVDENNPLTSEEYENIIKNMQLYSDPIRFNQLILGILSSISEKVNKIEEKLNLPELPKI